MANVKLSAIASGGALVPATDTLVAVRNGNTDVLVTPPAAGITRSVNSVSSNTAAGAAPLTDYVYLCSGTMTLTLPTAIGNTNRYTVKNVGTGVVTVATTSAQTIDGTTTQTLNAKQSDDFISDNANFNII